jgi:myo-inositol-1(or 4)-monophosphatase
MKNWDTDTIRDLLLESGRIAMHHFSAPETIHKSDASLLTIADGAVETFLKERLVGDDTDVSLIGEESVGGTTQQEADAALSGTTWVVDPIDGTAPYANKLPTWGISIGLLEDGVFSQGAWFLPRVGELYITSGGDVLFGEETRDPEGWHFDELHPLPKVDIPYTSTGMISLPHDIVRSRRFTGKNPIQSVGSAVYSLAQLVRGNYIGCITSLKLWDLAGAVPILRRMGCRIQFADRRELSDTVTSTDWVTDASHRQLWKARGALYVAHTEETLDYLHNHYRDDS